MKMHKPLGCFGVLAVMLFLSACENNAALTTQEDTIISSGTDGDSDDTGGAGDADGDSDGDVDSDSDGDADSDSDGDVDGDSDGDADSDTQECVDADSDWWCEPFDCDDGNDQIHPNAIDVVDNGLDEDCDGVTDEVIDIDTGEIGIPETCEEAEIATTTVGCLFYAIDLDTHDGVDDRQYAVSVSNVNQISPATVSVSKGNGTGWDTPISVTVPPMSLHTFELSDYHIDGSGFMAKGTYKIESDIPIIAYQFSPIDGASSWISDASTLIPVPTLSQTYDVIGWKQNLGDGEMRAYFTVVAVEDGTKVTVSPAAVPNPGGPVQPNTTPFTVDMNEGDVLQVETYAEYTSMTGSRVESNGHPLALFTGQECAYIPETVQACDHLEEQLPGLRFWGTEVVASRMPVRSTGDVADDVLWQVYASKDNTQVTFEASAQVTGLPESPITMSAGELLEFYVGGTQANPGDFHIKANEPIGVMQYMIGSANPNTASIGDPAMVYVSPVEQFLNRYVVLVPGTWVNDVLVITRPKGANVTLDGEPIPDSEFVPVADSGFEVARHPTPDGVHTLKSAQGISVIVVGYDEFDSYAYAGGMGLAAINPEIN